GLPGLNGFTGEVLSLIGMFENNRLYAALGLTGIILGAWYMLWLVQRTFFGRFREPLEAAQAAGHEPRDLNGREILALAPILALVVWIGVYPQFFIRRMEPSVSHVVAKLAAAGGPYVGAAGNSKTSIAARVVDPSNRLASKD
ncbi:MAG TPA: hypothetical protein VKU82_01370, partial [Planctomycetaceae bacterium]|nr:hypothetical protein [Planctomycetaceae bacterium]